MSWLNHQELMLVRGVGQTVATVTVSNGFQFPNTEQPIDTIDLLSMGAGISLATDGWSPTIPATKGGAIWADSSVEDGRKPISLANGNVIETLNLLITGTTTTEAANYLRVLHLFMKRCRDFWEVTNEIEPPYLRWWASGAPGRQFALIYNIEAAYTWGDSETPVINVVLTIEREPYWRGEVPPGDNPKRWTSYANNADYLSDPRLFSSPFLVSEGDGLSTLQNMNEYNAAATAFTTRCYFEVPAADIPGDAPALVWFNTFEENSNNSGLIAGVRSVNLDFETTNRPVYANTLNASDTSYTLGTDATRANDTGSVKAPGAGTAQRVEVSFATATDQLRFTWGPDVVNKYVGKWAVYLRCRQVNGTAGQILMYLRVSEHPTTLVTGERLPTTSPQLLGTNAATATWGLSYMGILQLPSYNSKAQQHIAGSGMADSNALNFGLYAQRTAGTGVLYFADLILIPLDECAFQALPRNSSDTFYIDTTGYMDRALGGDTVLSLASATVGEGADFRGRALTLQPGVTNRVYYLITSSDGLQSDVDYELQFLIHIVPRWSGIRDV